MSIEAAIQDQGRKPACLRWKPSCSLHSLHVFVCCDFVHWWLGILFFILLYFLFCQCSNLKQTHSLGYIHACIMFSLAQGSVITLSFLLLKLDQWRCLPQAGGSVCFPTGYALAFFDISSWFHCTWFLVFYIIIEWTGLGIPRFMYKNDSLPKGCSFHTSQRSWK